MGRRSKVSAEAAAVSVAAAEVVEAGVETIPAVPGLTDEERAVWERAVLEGRRDRDARRAAHREAMVARDGEEKTAWREGWTRKKDSGRHAVPETAAVRYLVCRIGGMPSAEANAVCGVRHLDVVTARARSIDYDMAYKAMLAVARDEMVDLAYSTYAEGMSGRREVTQVQARMAEKVLESLDRAHFGERLPAAAEMAKAAGGIVINLIDTSKPYVPPAIAAKGDPEEGVEV